MEKEDALIILVRYFNDIEILRMVFKWLPNVSIVDDEILKKKMKEKLQAGLEKM